MINKLVPNNIATLSAYSSARCESKCPIMLNANENPYNFWDYPEINRYPEPQSKQVLATLADFYQVEPDNLLLTRGADEGIDLVLRAFCEAGVDSVIVCPPTFEIYALGAKIQNAKVISVPLQSNDFTLDINTIIAAEKPKVIFLCSPNNPTGNIVSLNDIGYLCEFFNNTIIVIDEAYIEFAATASATTLINQYQNLIVLRTLSKAFGFAGARVGCLIAPAFIINVCKRIIAPYPIANSVFDLLESQLEKVITINLQPYLAEIRQQRQLLINKLKRYSWIIQVWPSEANFILIQVYNSTKIKTYCADNGILIRDRSHLLGLNQCLRLSIGTPQQNQKLFHSIYSLKYAAACI